MGGGGYFQNTGVQVVLVIVVVSIRFRTILQYEIITGISYFEGL